MFNIIIIILLMIIPAPQPINGIVLDQPNTIYTNLVINLATDEPGQAIIIKADNITLQNCIVGGGFEGKGIKWDQNQGILVYQCRDINIIGCQISNTGFDAIHVLNSTNVTISDCIIRNCGEGILFENSPMCSASGNILEYIGADYNTTQDGIEWSSCIGGLGSDNTMRYIDGSGYDVFNSSHIVLRDSEIYDYNKCGGTLGGIYLQGTTGQSNYNMVDNITIQKSMGAGIALYRANHNVIRNCHVNNISMSPKIMIVDDSQGNIFEGNSDNVVFLFKHDISLGINNRQYLLLVCICTLAIGFGLIIWGIIKWRSGK